MAFNRSSRRPKNDRFALLTIRQYYNICRLYGCKSFLFTYTQTTEKCFYWNQYKYSMKKSYNKM
jgi:hypothetical protein